MAAELGLDEIRAATLDNVGTSRPASGDDPRGLAEVAEAIDVARAANAHFELCRAMGNLAAGGRGGEAASALACWPGVPWAVAGAAYARGDYVAAAEQCAALGAVTQEAYVRLAAARAGDLVQLEPALEFYRSVGAAWYLRQGESILAASA
jgi:hypothetical protein